MFYSHEILTSPEHGVATVWLVATLGSRSITKRLNKKAILDVDVPKACEVVIDPVAPMALRLQGNLLYGITRVYNQQCGYALTDVQAMHDKMRSMLRAIPGTGLDPTAGKARPEQLILPYDPSFLPENNLPGLGLDLSRLRLQIEEKTSQQSGFSWPKTPDLSQTVGSHNSSLQLEFSSRDLAMDLGGFGSEADIASSVQRNLHLGRIATAALNDEEGILLQPDFEFDEDGNLIELGGAHAATDVGEHRSIRYNVETPAIGEVRDGNEISWDYQPMLVDEDVEAITANRGHTPTYGAGQSVPRASPDIQVVEEIENAPDNREATVRQTRRAPKNIATDDQTALRNTELAQFNNDYVQNMAAALKQKMKNKMPALAKKNAVFWVFGQGIGSVGVGLGTSRVQHPLHFFSGEDLYGSLAIVERSNKRKSSGASDDGSDADSETRRVRRRGEFEEQLGRGGLFQDNDNFHDDVEIARHAASALRDDNSSQMPWNITASVQSSRLGLSATSIFRGIGSISGFSSRGIRESTTSIAQLAAASRARNRLTSASPLAGRGLQYDLEKLAIPSQEEDAEVLGEFDLNDYLQGELDDEYNAQPKDETERKRLMFRNRLLRSSMDQESLNFLEFLNTQLEAPGQDAAQDSTHDNGPGARRLDTSDSKEVAFSTLLPPKSTSRPVATHGLMHILTLATKGFLAIHQEPYTDQSSEEYGVRYEFGEIYLRFSDM